MLFRSALERVSVVAGRLEELQRPQVCAHASIEQRPRASNTASNAILPLGTQLRLTLTHARGMILATGIPAIVVTV